MWLHMIEIMFLSPGTMNAIAINNEILMLNYQIKTFFFNFFIIVFSLQTTLLFIFIKHETSKGDYVE